MKQFYAQFESNRLKITVVLLLSALFTGLVVLLNLWKEIPIDQLLRDPVAITGVPFYTGFFSQTGIFFWAGTVAICLFGAVILSNSQELNKIKNFFIFSGMLTLLLSIDDIFLLHEEMFPEYIGIPEKAIFLIYGGLIGYFLIKFYAVILNTAYILLIMALLFFGFSVMLDVVSFQFSQAIQMLLEDSAKMVGIVSWFFYFFYSLVGVNTTYFVQKNPSSKDNMI